MPSATGANTVSRLGLSLSLVLLMVMTSGCATRALMSSDRYEKKEPTQQFNASELEQQELEQAYLLALHKSE